MRKPHRQNHGFTLIELSVVLVIIGLIIGGILVGQDMVSAAYTRAQISQIEKYNTAANTFKVKYGYLPGDIPDPYASQFGLQARVSRQNWPAPGCVAPRAGARIETAAAYQAQVASECRSPCGGADRNRLIHYDHSV